MRIDTAFPGQYLKAADLQGRSVQVIIDRVEMETVGDKQKPVLYFQGKVKGLALNKTNSNTVAECYGYETDDWHGKTVMLTEVMVDFQGRTVPAIRVRTPSLSQRATATVQRPLASPPQVNGEHPAPAPPRRPEPALIDDEIPF